jgi:hypothetical protein
MLDGAHDQARRDPGKERGEDYPPDHVSVKSVAGKADGVARVMRRVVRRGHGGEAHREGESYAQKHQGQSGSDPLRNAERGRNCTSGHDTLRATNGAGQKVRRLSCGRSPDLRVSEPRRPSRLPSGQFCRSPHRSQLRGQSRSWPRLGHPHRVPCSALDRPVFGHHTTTLWQAEGRFVNCRTPLPRPETTRLRLVR